MNIGSKFFESLACSVAAGATVAVAAKQASCSASHAYRLSQKSEFRQRVSELRLEATDRAVGALSDAAVEAVQVLRAAMHDEVSKPADRIAAARALLSLLAPVAELGELRSRLKLLESGEIK
jgi:hypothetical protein